MIITYIHVYIYMDLSRESLSLKTFPPWWYFARNNSIYLSPFIERFVTDQWGNLLSLAHDPTIVTKCRFANTILLRVWQVQRTRVLVPLNSYTSKGIHSAVKSRCRKFYFLFLPREKVVIWQNFSRINLKEDANSCVTISSILLSFLFKECRRYKNK